MISEAQVLDALKQVMDPELHKDLVSAGMIQNLKVEGNAVKFDLQLTTSACPLRSQLKQAAQEAVEALQGVGSVDVNITARSGPKFREEREDALPGVGAVIAVASGKGGVGKSTVSVNLALAMAEGGAKVGLLDADIYGPSVPTLMGVHERPRVRDGKIVPIEKYGIKLMSLGFLMDEDAAVIWRGPLVAGAIKQMLTDVDWGELDYLVVDLPPGTGDAQLTLAQSVPLTGVVVVTTSQDMALGIASKAALMFRKMNVPVLGIVENMSYFICPHCEGRTDIFSHGGGERAAEELDTEVLGQIPLEPQTVEDCDSGKPTVASRPESSQAQAFRSLACAVSASVNDLESIKDLVRCAHGQPGCSGRL